MAAATLVAAAEPNLRQGVTQQIITQADAAHRYAKRFGRAHPLWGNGSLMSRALLWPGPRPTAWQNEAFLTALSLVTSALARRKADLRQISHG